MLKRNLFTCLFLFFLFFFNVKKANSDGLPSDEVLEWAFGEGFEAMAISEIDDRWNERHGDIFCIKGTDIPMEALDRIEQYYNRLIEKEREKAAQ